MSEHAVSVTANFDVAVDPPLVRKFGVMNSGLVPIDRHRRDLQLLPALAPDSFRIDLCWGEPRQGWSEEPVQGTPEAPRYHFGEMDELARRLNDAGVLPYWSYGYMPPPLQQTDWRSVPSDLTAWGTVLRDMAKHSLDAGIEIGYHEVYNEPDLAQVFFTGTWEQYLELYAHGARGLKVGNPDARVGGPALAGTKPWTAPFLDFVERRDLPLDFFSFHVLNTGLPKGTLDNALKRLAQLRQDFGGRERFLTTEIHINEYHPYAYGDTHGGGLADKHGLAARIFSDLQGLLGQTDLTLVHWAQFMGSLPGVSDEGMGLVDLEGHRKAAFHAFEIYARMPVDRRRVTALGGLGALASADAHRAALVLWNETGQDRQAAVSLAALPFDRAHLQVYRIDREHSSYGDDSNNEELRPVEENPYADTAHLDWSGPIPNGGVVYLEVNDARAPHEPEGSPPARIIHLRRFYPNRGANSYADFDRRTWTARLGMGGETLAHEQIGVVAEDLPQALYVAFEVGGKPAALDANSLLGLRVDYADLDGTYRLGVLFHGKIYDRRRVAPMPWGTRRAPDRTVLVRDLAGFSIPIARLAPTSWGGRVTLTFLMQNTGADTRAKVSVRRAQADET